MLKLQWINLTLRAIMETGIVLALGYWGYHAGSSKGLKILFCIATPLIGFGFWGLVDFHQFGHFSEALRLIQELIISGLAAFALYTTGAHLPGLILGIVSSVYHMLVYINGDRLLKR